MMKQTGDSEQLEAESLTAPPPLPIYSHICKVQAFAPSFLA